MLPIHHFLYLYNEFSLKYLHLLKNHLFFISEIIIIVWNQQVEFKI